MNSKIKPGYRPTLLAGVAVVAMMSGQPVFAAPPPNSQTVTQTGSYDNEIQVQQPGTTGSTQVIYQSTTNAPGAGPQIYQTQVSGSADNFAYAGQTDGPSPGPGEGGVNKIYQTQYSSNNTAIAIQHGYSNTIVQSQAGDGNNIAVVGNYAGTHGVFGRPGIGPFSSGEGQIGFNNVVTQYQQGSLETAYANQSGFINNNGYGNKIHQSQNFVGGEEIGPFIIGPVGKYSYQGVTATQEGKYNSITQTQYSNSSQVAFQLGFSNTATQFQGYGVGGNYQISFQEGKYNNATQTQGYGVGHSGQFAGQEGKYNSITQTQTNGAYGATQYASQNGFGNTAIQIQGNGSAGSREQVRQSTVGEGGIGNYALQKQSYGMQYSSIYQFSGDGAGNVAYTFQTGNAGNVASIRQGGEGGAPAYGSKAYIVQHAKSSGKPNYAGVTQFGSSNEAIIDQGTSNHPVSGAYAVIDQYHVGGEGGSTAVNYALISQKSGTQYGVVRQINSGTSQNTAYIQQSGSGTGFAGVYQGGFEKGGHLLYAANPSVGVTNPIYQFTGVTNGRNDATGDKGYINQFTSAGYKSLAGIYQNVGNSLAVINQGTSSAPVSNDIALIYQCNGAGGICTGTAPVTAPGAYGNDTAVITQTSTFDYAKVVQMGLNDAAYVTQRAAGDVAKITQTGSNDYISLTQLGTGNSFSLTQNGNGDHVALTQH